MTTSQQIDQYIAELHDWRGTVIARLRDLINEADPNLQEDWKWGTPVWTHKGNVVALGAFKEHVKVNFFKGASLDDPKGLFNAGLEAKDTRSIDLLEGDPLDEEGIRNLVKAAANYNAGKR